MAEQNIKEELAKKAGAIKGEQPKEHAQISEPKKQVQISESEKQAQIQEAEKQMQISEPEAMINPDSEKRVIRLLRADEIECRVSTINEKGLSLFLFKDARVDQRILDETFTPFGWKRTHQCIDGNLYCTVEIWDEEKGQWIAKQDVGTTSYSEKEKGQASDSFKRACFNWGLGRELYTAPFIWVPATKVNIQRQGDRYTTNNKFFVHSIGYNHQREISALVLINQNGQKVFELKQKPEQKQGQKTENQNRKTEKNSQRSEEQNRTQENKNRKTEGKKQKPEEHPKTQEKPASDKQFMLLEKELKRTGISMEAVLSRYHLTGVEQMTEDIYTRAMNGLKKTKDAA
nr:hypothetical protein [uncultured Schaedlerella sp.]